MKKLGHKAYYRKLTVNIREDIYEKLKEKSEKEGKSVSLLINEILEKFLKKGKAN